MSKRNPRPKAADAEPSVPVVLDILRSRITRHEIPPGTKLLEEDLSAELKVSRARIRDVFAILQHRGLIQRVPNRGSQVVRIDIEQALHIYSVREALEGLCSRLATQNLPPKSWQDLVELFGNPIARDAQAGDLDGYIHKLETLRTRIHEGANNPVLSDILENIQDRTGMIIRRIAILPGRMETAIKEHRAVLAAMRRGDADAAEAATRANIRSGFATLKRYQSFVL